jgi:hypothetical protein
MSSVTYWYRVEPRPRADTLERDALVEALRARVRDPLWMLTRQWQLGEFLGADSGSPAYVQLRERQTLMAHWRPEGGAAVKVAAAPLEQQAEREPMTPDLATRVELGQTFESLLVKHHVDHLRDDFRAAFAIGPDPDDPFDAREVEARRLFAGRAIDGVNLTEAARQAQPDLPPGPAVPPGDRDAVLAALVDFVAWVTETFGAFGVADPPAWNAGRLEQRLEIVAPLPDGRAGVFSVAPGDDGLIDWTALDLKSAAPGSGGTAPEPTTRTMVPAHVRFRGMPNARFWDFETAGTDIGGMEPDRRDLARLALVDFMLVHGNDWFVLPIDLLLGSIYQLDSLVVVDVFGTRTLVNRADREPISRGEWSLFATTSGDARTAADFFVLPPSAGAAVQTAAPVEEVRIVRDEMANLAWAIEHLAENALGEAWLGRERDAAHEALNPVLTPTDSNAPLTYRIQSRVPEHWIPLVPVSLDPARGSVALELSAMLRGTPPTPIRPAGRVLRPTSVAGAYRIPEEEAARTGLRVQRLFCRSRWVDGTTVVWMMRRRGAGTGEANSGLRFDIAIPTP